MICVDTITVKATKSVRKSCFSKMRSLLKAILVVFNKELIQTENTYQCEYCMTAAAE